MSRRLSPQAKEECRVLYRSGDYSYRDLAEKFDVSKTTIMRTIKAESIKFAPPPPKISEDIEPRVMSFTSDPIQFRIQKFHEVSCSIDLVETRGNNAVQLHKLQIELHDQIADRIREQNGGSDIDDEAELLLMIQQAVIGMPPRMKEKLLETLSDDYSNIVQII